MPHEAILTPWEVVLERCRRLTDMQVWDVGARLDPAGWYANFLPHEQAHAAALLNRFLYFNRAVMAALMTSAIRSLSAQIPERGEALVGAWRGLLREAAITYVIEGELQPGDPGEETASIARELGLGAQLCTPRAAIQSIVAAPDRWLIVLDGFSGGGDRFIQLWNDRFGDDEFSLADLVAGGPAFPICYCPCLATRRAVQRIGNACPGSVVVPGQLFTDRHSAIGPESLMWPAALRVTAEGFLRGASERALAEAAPEDWRGEDELALTLGFARQAPRATLPLLRVRTPSWVPLIRAGA